MAMNPEELFEKIVANELQAVRSALAEEPSLVRARDSYLGSTPLHFASHRGFTEIVVALLDAGADIHARETASGTTPLHWAAEGGHPVIARMLIERGANLETRDGWYELSPLGWATVVEWAPPFHEDRAATAALLLEAGARPDIFAAVITRGSEAVRKVLATEPGALSRRLGFLGQGMQPLHLAVAKQVREMVPLLLELGTDIRARTTLGLTPLALALKNQDSVTAELLRAGGATEDISTALITGDLSALEARLKAEPRGEEVRGTLESLLFLAAREGMADAIGLLVRYGANPNARAKLIVGEVPSMIAPLHLAAKNGHVAAMLALLGGGAEPSAGSEEGTPTALHLAAGGGHMDCVRLLLERGADVKAQEKGFGATPLGWAEHGEHAEVVALLRERSQQSPQSRG